MSTATLAKSIRLACVSFVLFGLGVSSSPGQLTCRIAMSGQNNKPEISWTDPAPNDGYAVFTAPYHPDDAWKHAGDIDTWPTGATTWQADTLNAQSFFRVKKIGRGNRISVVHQEDFTAAAIESGLNLLGISGFTPQYNVKVYTVTYITFDPRGRSVLATGALCVPSDLTSAPLLSYQHGTIFLLEDAPSYSWSLFSMTTEQLTILALASEGYIVCAPDYLGLGGESPPLHPYCHARSEAVAAVDLLRATTSYLSGGPPAPNGQLFLGGYSQGGHATLALQRELEQNHAGEFAVTASAPMAGPHDLSGTMKALILAGVPYDSPSYVAYLLFGHNTVYPLFGNPNEVLVAPYDTTLPPLMNGYRTGSQIDAAMPSIPRQIFKAGFLADFTSNPSNALHAALVANDTYRWIPTAPTRFYHCAGDTTVPKANSDVAVAWMRARGATQVSITDPDPTANHSSGAEPCLVAAKTWFATLRTP